MKKPQLLCGSQGTSSINSHPLHQSNVRVVYSYAFIQMLEPILSDSHNILWGYYLKKKRFKDFVSMLRSSFFVWEMCNCTDKIRYSVDAVKSNNDLMSWIRANQNDEDVAILVLDWAI